MLGSSEMPLKLQLGSSQKQSYIELRLVQVRDTLAAPMLSTLSRGGGGALQHAESDESLDREGGHHVVPKEEGEEEEEEEGGGSLGVWEGWIS